METRRRIAGCAVMLSLIGACREMPEATQWVDPMWTQDLGFAPDAQRTKLIWRNHENRLYVSIDASRLVDPEHKLVMVSYGEAHADRRLIEESPSLRALDTTGEVHHALLLMNDQDHVDELAGRLHGHDPNLLSCGRIVRLGFTQSYDVKWQAPAVFPDIIRLPAVADLITLPKSAEIKADVQTLEGLGTRFHNAANGAEVTSTVKEMFLASGAGIANFSVSTVDHSAVLSTRQQSVVAKIVGTSDPDHTIVIGAHLDSINSSNNNDAPGADDDASGVATIAAMIRALAQSGATLQRTVEFHAYAAEEVGLEGSRHIAETYADAGRTIVGMMQLDMTSFSSQEGDSTIWLISNNTHPNLRRSLKDLMHTYLNGGFAEGTLAGGTSDHEAWTSFGFPAVFPFENPQDYNTALHTANDTSTTANNYPLATRFAQLGLAFLAHYGGLDEAQAEFEAQKAAAVAAYDKDLKLAIAEAENGSYYISVSAPQTVAHVALCKAKALGSRRCFEDLVATTSEEPLAERKRFTTIAKLALASDDRLVVFGYNSEDKVVAQRTVKLTQR